jgi:hypothetical protein
MSGLAQTPMIAAERGLYADASPFVTVRILRALSRFVETGKWIAFAAVSLLCGWARPHAMATRHLDHDELFTFYIAQAPTLRQMLVLTRTIDLHPPLSYLLVRGSFAIFGVSAWSCRLPSFVAFVLTTVLLFWFVTRMLSPVHGLIPVLLLWSSPYSYLATEARSYSLLLCFTTLVLVSWYQAATHTDGRRWALLGVALGGVGLFLSHVLALFSFLAIVSAEGVRWWIRRKPDWQLWAALMAPTVAVLSYLPLVRLRTGVLYAEQYQATPWRLASGYWEALRLLLTPYALIALLVVAWHFLSKPRNDSFRRDSLPARVSLRALLLFLFLVPLEVGVLFARTGTAFFERYGIVMLIPCVVFPVLFLAYRTCGDRLAASAGAVLLVVLFVFNTSGKAWLVEELSDIFPPKVVAKLLFIVASPPMGAQPLKVPQIPPYLGKDLARAPLVTHLDTVEPGLPLVAGNGPTFLELDKYENAALTGRLYLLTDHEAASNIAHSTVFDTYGQARTVFPIRGQVEPYCAFVHQHSEFLVLGGYNHPDTWLLRKLERDGAHLSIIGTYDDGVIEEHHIYRVSVANDHCEASGG